MLIKILYKIPDIRPDDIIYRIIGPKYLPETTMGLSILIAPIIEEIMYRGFPMMSLTYINQLIDYLVQTFPNIINSGEQAKYFSDFFIMILTSLIFGVAHKVKLDQRQKQIKNLKESQKKIHDKDNLMRVIMSFAIGIVLFAFAQKYGLLSAIALHSFININHIIWLLIYFIYKYPQLSEQQKKRLEQQDDFVDFVDANQFSQEQQAAIKAAQKFRKTNRN